MRVITRKTVLAFAEKHPETAPGLGHWLAIARGSRWSTMADVQRAFPKAKVLNAERVRFEVAGGNYRMVVAIDFARQIAFVKFIGSHAEYDRVDALRVSRF